MCFSSTASFTVAGITAAAGLAAMAMVPSRRYALFAAIPLGFSFQQLIEGMIWCRLDAGVPGETLEVLSSAFLLIGQATWPLMIPIAIWLIEPDQVRKKWIGWLALLGGALFALFTIMILASDYTVWIDQHALHYEGEINVIGDYAFYPFNAGEAWHLAGLDWTVIPYAVATLGSLFLSSHRLVRTSGILAGIGLVTSLVMHSTALISVWCFFAAAACPLIVLQVRKAMRGDVQPSA